MITISPVTPVIGAEVSDIDLSEPLTGDTFVALSDALIEHKVLFFRDQHNLTPESHVRFGRSFGPLTGEPFRERLAGIPEITLFAGFGAERYRESWHSDQCHEAEPPMACILRAVEVPPVGRDTMWANMEAVYTDLSDKMQRFLSELAGYYDISGVYGKNAGRASQSPLEKDMSQEEVPPMEHPVIRTHPVSGRKCVFVNKVFTKKIVGLSERESTSVLEFLFEQVRDPEYHVRLRWAPGTVAMWDNRCTQHRLIIDLPPTSTKRMLHRVTVCGDKPF